ncbi:MAG: Xaa-Pro dipeptidase [Bacillota bacterium]|nr:MAG: Xaa-Pro dipeptidase [Bacillota bacterium]
MVTRLEQLRQVLPVEVDAILILKPDNRAYITGFTGSAGYVLVGKNMASILTDFRYVEQASAQATEFTCLDYAPSLHDALNKALNDGNITKLGFESDFVTFGNYQTLKENLVVELVPVTGAVEKLRMVKDEAELSYMQKATEIAEAALEMILPKIKAGVSEAYVALELEVAMRRLGGERLAFDSISASGPRSSLPHGRASERVIQTGDFLTLDFGAVYNGYCCDMTRSFVIGTASPEQEKIYNIVLEAQRAALAAVRPGIVGKDVDKVARDIISAAGYGERFGHGLGHGVGRMVHEGPSAGSKSEDILQPGMVVTIEPGIYIPEWGGVRIEDMVVVTENGYRNFNRFSKELICL